MALRAEAREDRRGPALPVRGGLEASGQDVEDFLTDLEAEQEQRQNDKEDPPASGTESRRRSRAGMAGGGCRRNCGGSGSSTS